MVVVAEISTKEWEDFCNSHTEISIFQSPDMYQVYAKTKGIAPETLFDVESETLRGVLLSVRQAWGPTRFSSHFGRDLILAGPVGDFPTIKKLVVAHQRRAAQRSIFSEIRPFIADPQVSGAALACGFRWRPHGNYLVDLSQGERRLWNSLSRSRRKNIRRAEKSGLRIRAVDSHETAFRFCELVERTYERAGLPAPHCSLFNAALEVLGPRTRWIALLAEENGNFIAGRAALVSKGIIHDWYAGSTDQGRSAHADELLVWNLFLQGIAIARHTFDFGGSGADHGYGPGEFKRQFGGRFVTPGRMIAVHRPIEYILGRATWTILSRIRSG